MLKSRNLWLAIAALICLAGNLRQAYSQEQDKPCISRNSLVIKLERGGYYQNAYTVTIDGNGNVTYEGTRGVKVPGTQSFQITIAEVDALISAFCAADFFAFEAEYNGIKLENGMSLTTFHQPTARVTLDADGKTKSVFDEFGAPDRFKDLTDRIDELSFTRQFSGIKSVMRNSEYLEQNNRNLPAAWRDKMKQPQ